MKGTKTSGENMVFKLLIFHCFTVVVGISNAALAATCTHYVSSAGNASWANATNISTPASVSAAFANAVADNVVCFRGGTYAVPAKNGINYLGNQADTYHGYYEPVNSGTFGHPITFQAYPGETPIFNGTAIGGEAFGTNGAIGETIFGAFNQTYIVFDGFIFESDNGATMARTIIGSNDLCNSYVPISTHVTVQNCTFNGGSNIHTGGDNAEGLRAECVSDLTVKNNIFYHYRESTDNHNTSAFKEYNIANLLMINNEFSGNTNAVYLKRACDTCAVAYNYIHDNYLGIFANAYNAGTEFDHPNLSIYHNVLSKNSYNALDVYTDHGEIAYADNAKIFNNTIYNPTTNGGDVMIDFRNGRNASMYNNIIYGGQTKLAIGDYAYNSLTIVDYNQYGNLGNFAVQSNVYGNAGTQFYTSLSSWQAANVGGGTPIHPDAHSLASNPLFSNTSGNFSQLADFNLQAGSPCKGKGQGGVDMGANISLVGSASPSTYTIGGTLSGLSGTVTLQNNGGDNLSRSANGPFTFATALINGTAYLVTVLTQPTGQTCTVASGSGTINSANVTDVNISCINTRKPSIVTNVSVQ
jgi:hypothetical protein